MFCDLLDENIQPQEIDIRHIPDIEISASLRQRLQKALEEEEENTVVVSGKTAIVKTDKNYVFFSNQWLYLAVICKKYADALKIYGDFFDNTVRGNQELLSILVKKDYNNPKLIEVLSDELDRERFIKFIEPDSSFRPGKALLNGEKARTTKDIFGSCVLKKIPVPDASSAYLGNLIYYLAKRPELYDELEKEVVSQIGKQNGAKKMPSIVKECARAIIDHIYDIDAFEAIQHLFEINDKNIKVDIGKTEGLLPNGNFLRYLFTRPNSDMYSQDVDRARVFYQREYFVTSEGEAIPCRLTTEWVDSELEEGGQGNFLKALIAIVNKYYNGRIEIKSEFGERYLYIMKDKFELKDLPEVFHTEFARRYVTSLLAKPFVVLTGNSGTGKTRISKQFAEYMEWISDEGKKNWLIVPVGADWTDNSRILGFYNPIANYGTGKYESTNIVHLIEEANKHSDIPYFLILDEMNLSHVERYFSDFLSHMETPDTNFILDGYTGEQQHLGELEYPDNLFVVGTVNIDETTYMFSPKVLDRANVIEFKPEKEDVLKMFSGQANTSKVRPAYDGTAEAFLKLSKEIRAGKLNIDESGNSFYGDSMTAIPETNMNYVENVFSEIYEIVEKSDFEFAFRTVKEIKQYISSAYELSDGENMDLNSVLDEQLLQKIMPKIHGNKKEIGELLESLGQLCQKYRFVLSEKKIEQMKGKLVKVQYASFI